MSRAFVRKRARPRTVLLDANLLCLLIVGSHDPRWIPKHKRTRSFTGEDFILLSNYLSKFSRVLTLPNILTEASNLLRQTDEPASRQLMARLGVAILESEERHLESRGVCQSAHFQRLGLTDSAILEAAGNGVLVLTADLHLYLALQDRGAEAVNFHHLRFPDLPA